VIGPLLLATLWAATPAVPERLDFSVQPGAAISADEPNVRHVESVLAIDPNDARHLVAASMVLEGSGGIRVYATHDGGRTWARGSRPDVGNGVFPGLDPALAFDARGHVYLATLGKAVEVWKSNDGGKTWSGGVSVPAAGDRPFLQCLPAEDGGLPRVLVSSKYDVTISGRPAAPWYPGHDVVSLSMSSDGGKTFASPRLLLLPPEQALLNVVGDLEVLPGGKALLVLQTFRSGQDLMAPILTGSYQTMTWSPKGGFSIPRPIAEFHLYGHSNEGKSAFGYGFARIAADASARSARRGKVYATWLDVVDGSHRVMAASSADEGATWSAPVRVDEGAGHADASNPAVAVDGQGIVGISWNDRRGDPTGRCYQTYFAASGDGGATFSAGLPIERGFTCPIGKPGPSAAPDPSVDPMTSDYRFKNGGDTQGIVGLPGGGFHLAWINGASGEMGLWHTVVRVGPTEPPREPRR
jgi:hypothetical protein